MRKLADPAGWTARDLAADDRWIYELSGAEIEDICLVVGVFGLIGYLSYFTHEYFADVTG
ncbi:MAG: hypothetical protein VX741_14515 [Pseudomonadota bacterium]|nr:hypothetical protein [Pseudomonadota bacterium]